MRGGDARGGDDDRVRMIVDLRVVCMASICDCHKSLIIGRCHSKAHYGVRQVLLFFFPLLGKGSRPYVLHTVTPSYDHYAITSLFFFVFSPHTPIHLISSARRV